MLRARWPRTKCVNLPPLWRHPQKKQTPTFSKFSKNMNYKTSHIFKRIWTALLLNCLVSYGCAKFSKKVVHMGLKGLKCNYIEILGKTFVGCIFKRNKISNGDISRLKSPQWELSDDVLHMTIACVLVELLPFKMYVTHESFWWLPIFFTPKLEQAHGFFENFLHKWR